MAKRPRTIEEHMAFDMGLRSDSMLSDLINGYSLPSAKTLSQPPHASARSFTFLLIPRTTTA